MNIREAPAWPDCDGAHSAWCDGAHSAWDWADPGEALGSVLVAAADTAGGGGRRGTGPKGSGGDVPHEGQEHTGCRQVKGQKHTECRTEALSAERIRDVATRGSPPTIYMVGVRAKIHGHTRDYHPGLAPGVHTQPAARAICTSASRRITRGFQHARPNPNLVIISCHSGPGRDTYCSQK